MKKIAFGLLITLIFTFGINVSFAGIMDGATTAVSGVVSGTSKVVGGVIGGVSDVVGGVIGGVSDVVGGVVGGITGIFTGGDSSTASSSTGTTTTTSTQNPYSYTAKVNTITNPVFSGPGLVGGATIMESNLDNHISKERDLKKLIIGWTKFLYPIAALLAVVAIVWAGVLAITARGDDGQIENAKKIIVWVVIGIIAILGAYALVNTVMQAAF